MKAMAIEAFGGTDVLKLMDLPKPTVKDDEILIKITHAGVNPVDWKIREGFLQSMLPHEFPLILGWDASGEVAEVGKNISAYKAGDNVYGYCRKPTVKEGCYAEFTAVNSEALALAPKNIDLAQAAAIPLAGLTAWQSIFDFAGLKEGQTILIHAGAGGVGSLAIQFAKHAGAKVYSTGSAKNHDYIKSLGADHIIDYTKESFLDVINKEGKVDVVYDTVGGDTQKQSFEIVKEGGVLVTIVDGPDEKLAEEKKVKAGFVFVAPNAKQLAEITGLIEEGKVAAPQIQKMKLEEASEALRLNQERHVRGKIILEV